LNEARLRLHFLDVVLLSRSFDLGPALHALYDSNDLRAEFPERATTLRVELEHADSAWALDIPPLDGGVAAETSIAYGPCFYAEGRFLATHEGEPRQRLDYVPALGRVRANVAGRTLAGPLDLVARFLRPLLRSFVTTLHGLRVLHGAAVTRTGRTVLFTGAAGAGKTTTALAFARAGWAVLADDSPFLTLQAGRCLALSSLDFLQAAPATLALFPELQEGCVGEADERGKRMVRGTSLREGDGRRAWPVTDLVALRRTPEATRPRLVPGERSDVVRGLLEDDMTVFRRRPLRADPTLRAASTFVIDVLAGLVSGARVATLEYADGHLFDLPTLIDAAGFPPPAASR
jgi:hypothetical protein